MTISSEQAAQALRDLDAVGQRSGTLYRYQRTAPILMVWGVIWLIGFGLSDLAASHVTLLWLVLDAIGIASSIYLGRAGKRAGSAEARDSSRRWLLSIFGILGFYVAVLVVLQPATGQQSAALISLLVALFYILAGVWVGLRFAIAGLALAALTLVGYFALNAHFNLWMAVVGGGALLLAGFWLRRA